MNYYNLDDCDDCWLMHHRRWFPILMIDIAQSGHHLLYLSLTKYTKAVYTKLQCPQHTENLKMLTFPRYGKEKATPQQNRHKSGYLATLNHCQQGDFKMKIWGTDSKQKSQNDRKKKIRCWEIYWLCSSRSTFFNGKMIIWSSILLNLHWWRPQSSSRTIFLILKSLFLS